MNRLYYLTVIGWFYFAATQAAADQWISPQEKTILSRNSRYQVRIIPSKKGGFANAPLSQGRAKAILKGPAGEKTFDLKNPWMPVDVVLLDDGTLLTFDNWHCLGYGQVVVAYQKDGTVRFSLELKNIFSPAQISEISRSVSSIWWRKTPLIWALGKGRERPSIEITLWDENKLAIDLRDGITRLIPVTDLGTDPEKMLTRAKALINKNKPQEALELAQRVVANHPNHLNAHVLYGELIFKTQQYRRADQLEKAISRFFKTTPTAEAYQVANLCTYYAQSLIALNKKKAAEAILKKALQFKTGYTFPLYTLSNLLWDSRRYKDLEGVFDHFLVTVKTTPKVHDFEIAQAVKFVGEFYERHQKWTLAKKYFLMGYSKAKVTDQFLYERLAETYERLGEFKKALLIYQALILHWKSLGSRKAFQGYIDRAEKAIRRLKSPGK